MNIIKLIKERDKILNDFINKKEIIDYILINWEFHLINK